MTLNGLCIAVTTVLLLALAWKWRRNFAVWKLEERAAAVLLPFLLFAAVLQFVKSPNHEWIPHTFGIAAKLGLNVHAGNGPPVSAESGPLAALAFLPLLFFGTPAEMGAAGGLLTGLFLLIPLAWAHRSCGGYRPPFTVLGFLLSYVALAGFEATARPASAAAAGFGILACAVLFRRGEEPPPGTRSLILSALFAALSLGCLPVAVPLWLALAAHLWNAWGFRWCGRFLIFFAGSCAGLAAIVIPLFGAHELWSSMTLILLKTSSPIVSRPAGEALLIQGWPVLAGLVVLASLRVPQANAEGVRFRRGPWLIPFLAGLFTMPLALRTYTILGRDPLFLPLFYLVASLSLLIAATAGAGGEERSRRLARAIGVVLAGATLAFAGVRVVATWMG